MTGKSPLGLSKEPQSYEGLPITVPVNGWSMISSKRDPTSNDKKFPVTSIWVNTVLENVWMQVAPGGVWIQLANSSGDFLITAPLTTNGVVYATGSNGGTSTAAGTSGQLLQSKGAGSPPAYTTATYPATTTINQILYSSAANTVTGLATANNGTLVTSASGVPSILVGPGVTGDVLMSNAAAAPSWQALSELTIVDQISSSAALAGGTTYITDNGASLVTYTLPATVNRGTKIKIVGGSVGGWKIAQNAGQTIIQGGQTTTSGTGGSVASTTKADSIELTAFDSTTNVWVVSASNGATLTFV